MLTLDEAIKHCEEKAKELREQAGFDTGNERYRMSESEKAGYLECAEEHKQLAEWLKELKNIKACIKSECLNCMRDKKGEWIKITRKGTVPVEYVCSCCGRKIYDDYELSIPMSEFYPYCHCGADMRKGGAE